MEQRVTIAEVARRAGVSPTTVSHALSGRRPVSEKTAERVRAAVLRLGYRPHATARSLRTSRTQTVALAVPDIANPFYPSVMRGMVDELREAGYRVVVHNTDGERPQELAVLTDLGDGSVDGAVIFSFHLGIEDLAPLAALAVPMVGLGDLEAALPGLDIVRSADRDGIAAVTSRLLERVGGPLAFVGGPADARITKRRLEGYRLAHRRAGTRVDPRSILFTDFSSDGGASAGAMLLDRPRPPRGIVCANDLVAIGVLGSAQERGLRVPAEVAVTGFDDIAAAALVRPRLTTVSNGARQHGQTCAALLLDRLRGEYTGPTRRQLIPTELVVRDSG